MEKKAYFFYNIQKNLILIRIYLYISKNLYPYNQLYIKTGGVMEVES